MGQNQLEIIKIGKLTVQGIAYNAKAGAVIVTENDSTYYISGMREWKNKYYEKTLSVTGYCIIEKRTFEKRYHPNGDEIIVAHLPERMVKLKRTRRIRIIK
ncbi:MAG: hypothetical protein WDZ35_14670 [Crocinitomicaceae bacterium]